eukprot:11249057-Ditylum_brightwellii.AAC.1
MKQNQQGDIGNNVISSSDRTATSKTRKYNKTGVAWKYRQHLVERQRAMMATKLDGQARITSIIPIEIDPEAKCKMQNNSNRTSLQHHGLHPCAQIATHCCLTHQINRKHHRKYRLQTVYTPQQKLQTPRHHHNAGKTSKSYPPTANNTIR